MGTRLAERAQQTRAGRLGPQSYFVQYGFRDFVRTLKAV